MRTTISLPDGLGELARIEARRRGVSVSAIVRYALEKHLRRPVEARLPWQGMVNDPSTNARMLDEVLSAGWAHDVARNRR